MQSTVTQLHSDTAEAITTLAKEFKELMKDAMITINDDEAALVSARQKLQIDVHTVNIDHAARNLLMCIRKMKELKVTDNSYQDERNEFEKECIESANQIDQKIAECFQQLTVLSEEGFEVLQQASKLIR